jgi:Uma2 family endonuclease
VAQAVHAVRYTFGEYVRLEEVSNVKHEYVDGRIYAMAGGSPEHAALQASVSARLFIQLEGGPCRVYSPDLRVRVAATGLATYPDSTVVYGPLERDPADANTILNPKLIVEVLSPRTEEYDRGEKFENYQQISALGEYVLVNHSERRIEVWRRDQRGDWTHFAAGSGESIRLESIDCTLDVDAVYQPAQEPTR